MRSGHELRDLPEEISEEAKKKTRRMLGLGESGAREVSVEQREGEIEQLISEMRKYLEKLKQSQENIIGMILCGSRMDTRKVPAQMSDVDAVLVFKPGFTLDPSTPEGEKILLDCETKRENNNVRSDIIVPSEAKQTRVHTPWLATGENASEASTSSAACRAVHTLDLRNFSDNTPTDFGLPVELDEFFAEDALVAKLAATDPSMLVWGWNAQATRYIGDEMEGEDEGAVNERIHELLAGEVFEAKRKEKVKTAAEKFLAP